MPDGYHSNLDYINLVKPGGTGDANHKELYNYKSILKIFDNDFKYIFWNILMKNMNLFTMIGRIIIKMDILKDQV